MKAFDTYLNNFVPTKFIPDNILNHGKHNVDSLLFVLATWNSDSNSVKPDISSRNLRKLQTYQFMNFLVVGINLKPTFLPCPRGRGVLDYLWNKSPQDEHVSTVHLFWPHFHTSCQANTIFESWQHSFAVYRIEQIKAPKLDKKEEE